MWRRDLGALFPIATGSIILNTVKYLGNLAPSFPTQPSATMDDEDDRRYDDDEDDEEEEGERLPPKVEELAQASVPTTLKGVRACLCCGIVKTLDQFLEYG
jgi:hypothetical protein